MASSVVVVVVALLSGLLMIDDVVLCCEVPMDGMVRGGMILNVSLEAR